MKMLPLRSGFDISQLGFGTFQVIGDPRLSAIAKRHDGNPAQVALAWAMEKGIVVIPKASGRQHIEENLQAEKLTLSSQDIVEIDNFQESIRTIDGSWKHYPFD